MKIFELVRTSYASLAFNFVYALPNCIVGFIEHSWWFLTVGVYHAILAITRFSILQIKRKAHGNYDIEFFAIRVTGILLIVLSFCIIGMNILSALKERGTVFREIIMLFCVFLQSDSFRLSYKELSTTTNYWPDHYPPHRSWVKRYYSA